MGNMKYILNDDYSIKEIKDLREFAELKPVWDELSEKQDAYRPFLCFDWFKLSLEHFLNNDELLVITLYRRDGLEAIAPFLIRKQRFKGLYVRKVELIGNVYSPIQTFLYKDMEDEARQRAVRLILSYFTQINKQWDVIDLSSIPIEYNNFELICEAVTKSNFNSAQYFCFANWFMESISYSSDTYFKLRSKNLRASIKKNIKNAKNRGNLEFKMLKDSNGIDEYISQYREVYSKSWKEKERIGDKYLIEWMSFAATKGWLRLGIVRLDGVTIAAGFAILCNGFAYLAKTAYDKEYAELGPGSIWLTEMMKYIVDIDKVSVIDLLRGDEEYKRHWVDRRRERKGILIFNNNIKGYCLSILIQHVLPAVNRSKGLRKIKASVKNMFLQRGLRSGD